jgi:hypothetical protein
VKDQEEHVAKTIDPDETSNEPSAPVSTGGKLGERTTTAAEPSASTPPVAGASTGAPSAGVEPLPAGRAAAPAAAAGGPLPTGSPAAPAPAPTPVDEIERRAESLAQMAEKAVAATAGNQEVAIVADASAELRAKVTERAEIQQRLGRLSARGGGDAELEALQRVVVSLRLLSAKIAKAGAQRQENEAKRALAKEVLDRGKALQKEADAHKKEWLASQAKLRSFKVPPELDRVSAEAKALAEGMWKNEPPGKKLVVVFGANLTRSFQKVASLPPIVVVTDLDARLKNDEARYKAARANLEAAAKKLEEIEKKLDDGQKQLRKAADNDADKGRPTNALAEWTATLSDEAWDVVLGIVEASRALAELGAKSPGELLAELRHQHEKATDAKRDELKGRLEAAERALKAVDKVGGAGPFAVGRDYVLSLLRLDNELT